MAVMTFRGLLHDPYSKPDRTGTTYTELNIVH